MRYISLKVLFITCLVGFGLISCGGSGSSGGSKGSGGADGASGANTCQTSGYEPVHDVASLKAIATDAASMAGDYCLENDITLTADDSADGFPLGWNGDDTKIIPFTGNFDGQDNTISNLTVAKDDGKYIGLFAKIGGTTSSEIKDLTLDKFNITGLSHVGALAGQVEGTIIESVQVTTVTSEAKNEGYVGGLIGKVEGGTITTSSVAGTVTSAGANAGSLAGSLTGSAVTKSYSSATVTATDSDNVGGLIGYVDNSADTTLLIDASYATGAVSGRNSVGGLVGQFTGKIIDSYATGDVAAISVNAGGLIGKMEGGSVANTYAIGVVDGSSSKGGLIGRLEGAGTVTNSYFDLQTTTATTAIGDANGVTITPALHTGVNGKKDIKGDGATPAVYRTVADFQNIIFEGWDETNWNFADGQWPILERQGALTAGTVNPAIVRDCADTSYTAVYDVVSLKNIANDMAGDYCLYADIDLAGVTDGFPLGWAAEYTDIINFTGNFDGEDHTISNLVIDKSANSYIGLFSKIGPEVGKSSEIKNLNLVNFNIEGIIHVGALVGVINDEVTISKVKINNAIIKGNHYVGGLVGYVKDSNGKVIDSAVIGGTVTSKGNAGGMIGSVYIFKGNSPTISNSYATSVVSGVSYVGGLVGRIAGGGIMSNSYATGMVTATAADAGKGGLIGGIYDCIAAKCSVTNSYFDTSINSGINAIGEVIAVNGTITGLVGVNGKADITEAIGTPGIFKTVGNSTPIFSGWSVDDWKFATGNWPILKWQTETLTADTPTPTCKSPGYMTVNDIDELKAIGDDAASMAKSYCLTADIDLVGVTDGFPLGWDAVETDITAFTGNFDGEDHTISNLVVDRVTDDYIGLFSKIGGTTSSEIKDLNLVDFRITGKERVGALTGHAEGEIKITSVKVTTVASEAKDGGYAGGLIGKVEGGAITTSSVVGGTIKSAGSNVGGLVGSLTGASVTKSDSGAIVTVTGANSNFVGGLIGYVDNSADTTLLINGNYATGDVSGGNTVGGLVGQLKGKIIDSYATGNVLGVGEAGGLVGLMESGSVSNTYAIGVVNGTTKGLLIGKLKDACTDCRVTNSYFDKSANTATNAIGNKGTTTITPTLHTGVNGKEDIKGDGATPAVYRPVDNPQSVIFDGWDEANWNFADGNWPILERQGALSAGTVNLAPADRTCSTAGYKAVHDIAGLKAIGDNVDDSMAGDYCLTADIDLASATGDGSGFPLGWRSDIDITAFTGNFDGEGKTISNLIIDKGNNHNMGLFAGIGGAVSSEIKDLTLNNFKITGGGAVGALMGRLLGEVTISKVKINGAIINGDDNVGGLIGHAGGSNGKITDSAVIGGKVTGNSSLGGMIGQIHAGGRSVGAAISNSYATSAVSGNIDVGGLVGIISNGGSILDSYATGIVTVTGNNANKGGLIGLLDNCTTGDRCIITNSYFDKSGTNSGISDIGSGRNSATTTGLVGVAGANDIGMAAGGEFQTIASPNDNIFVDWDATIWQIIEGAWPTFKP